MKTRYLQPLCTCCVNNFTSSDPHTFRYAAGEDLLGRLSRQRNDKAIEVHFHLRKLPAEPGEARQVRHRERNLECAPMDYRLGR